ncbi:MAG: hypothetical protein EHM61_27680 [Acidobacteria bacterium]|nr:MAG: hypothetical protein EHM61_27680 [Acidobacteriota bacterium]
MHRWLAPILSGAVLLISAVVLLYPNDDEPATAEVRGKLLLVLNRQGETLWSQEFPETDESFYGEKNPVFLQESILVADVDSDGHKEVLFNYRPRTSARPDKPRLICFDRDGRVLWEFAYGRAKRWGSREFSPLYFGRSIHLVRLRDRATVMTIAHHMFFPAQVAFLKPADGAPLWEYWHPGHLSAALLVDLDDDGQEEVVLSGINNPGPGIGHAALLALKPPLTQMPPISGKWQEADAWGGNEYRYILFPRSRVGDLIGGGGAAVELFEPSRGKIGVHLAGGLEEQRHICWSGIYEVDFEFNVLDFRPHDCFRATVDWFIQEGKLRPEAKEGEFASLRRVLHFKAAPDANSPEVAHLWNAAPSSKSD